MFERNSFNVKEEKKKDIPVKMRISFGEFGVLLFND